MAVARPPRRGRHERTRELEQLAGEAIVDPRRDHDPASRSANPHELRRGTSVIGREHRAEHREHPIEARVGKGQVLSVPLDPLHINASGRRAPPRMNEQLGRHIHADDYSSALSSRNRDIAAAPRADIQQADPRLHRGALQNQLAHRRDQSREAIPGPSSPARARTGLEIVNGAHATTPTHALRDTHDRPRTNSPERTALRSTDHRCPFQPYTTEPTTAAQVPRCWRRALDDRPVHLADRGRNTCVVPLAWRGNEDVEPPGRAVRGCDAAARAAASVSVVQNPYTATIRRSWRRSSCRRIRSANVER